MSHMGQWTAIKIIPLGLARMESQSSVSSDSSVVHILKYIPQERIKYSP